MQIRLLPSVAKNLSELVKIYRKTDPDYNLSPTRQGNLLLKGRLGMALDEARLELKRLKK